MEERIYLILSVGREEKRFLSSLDVDWSGKKQFSILVNGQSIETKKIKRYNCRFLYQHGSYMCFA